MTYILIKDATFVRANTSPSPNPGSVGDGWIDDVGSIWEINSNTAFQPSAPTLLVGDVLLRPSGEAFADGKVRIYPNSAGIGGSKAAIAIARWQDRNNFLNAFCYNNDQMTIATYVSGVQTQIASDTGIAFPGSGAWYAEFVLTGSSLALNLYDLSNNLIHSVTVTDSSILSAGQWGIAGYSGPRFMEVIGYEVEGAFAPGRITKNSDTTSSVSLTAGDASGGLAPYTYQWYRSQTPGFTPGPGNILSGKTSLSLNDTGLSSGQTYYYVMQYMDSTSPTPQSVNSAQFTEVVPSIPPVIIGFIGDSITAGIGTTHQAAEPIQEVQFLNKHLVVSDLYSEVNQGVSGSTTADWVGGSTNLNSAITAFQGASVTDISIMLGTNDSKIAVATSQANYIANIQNMIAALKVAGFTSFILNCAPYVNGDPAVWDPTQANGLLLQYLAANAIIAAADPTHVRVGDTLAYSWFQDNISQLGDGVHPDDDGSVSLGYLWAQGFAPSGGTTPPTQGTVINVPPLSPSAVEVF